MNTAQNESGSEGFAPFKPKGNWKPVLLVLLSIMLIVVAKTTFRAIRSNFHQTKLVETFEISATQKSWSEKLVVPTGYSVEFEPTDLTVRWLVRVDGGKIFNRPPVGTPEYCPTNYGNGVKYFEFALESGQEIKATTIRCVRRLR